MSKVDVNKETHTLNQITEKESKPENDKFVRITTESCEVVVSSNDKKDNIDKLNKLARADFELVNKKKLGRFD